MTVIELLKIINRRFGIIEQFQRRIQKSYNESITCHVKTILKFYLT